MTTATQEQVTFDDHYSYRSFHDCPRCGLSRASAAHTMMTGKPGSDEVALVYRAMMGCRWCRPVMMRWWRIFGRGCRICRNGAAQKWNGEHKQC